METAGLESGRDMLIRPKLHLVLGCEVINGLHVVMKCIPKGASSVGVLLMTLEPLTIPGRASRRPTLQIPACHAQGDNVIEQMEMSRRGLKQIIEGRHPRTLLVANKIWGVLQAVRVSAEVRKSLSGCPRTLRETGKEG